MMSAASKKESLSKASSRKAYATLLKHTPAELAKTEIGTAVAAADHKAVFAILSGDTKAVLASTTADLLLFACEQGFIETVDVLLYYGFPISSECTSYVSDVAASREVDVISQGLLFDVSKPVTQHKPMPRVELTSPKGQSAYLIQIFKDLQKKAKEVFILNLELPMFPLMLLQFSSTLAKADLRGNKITSLPPAIERLTALKKLYLQDNLLQELPVQFSKMTHLQKVKFDGNPMSTIPPSIIKQGLRPLQQYLVDLNEGSVVWQKIKLMFVGKENVGKTTMLTNFRETASTPNRKALTRQRTGSNLSNPPLSTDGINIVPLESGKVTFSAWDFGGQDVFYPTHQFFLTDRAIYLVTFSMRDPDYLASIEYWVRQIKSMVAGARPPVFIVGTHRDTVEKNVTDEIQKELERFIRHMKNLSNIRACHLISLKNDVGVKDLKSAIVECAAASTLLKEMVPGSYLRLEHKVNNLKITKSFVSWIEYAAMAAGTGIKDSAIPVATQFLHDVGSLLRYENPARLRDTVILDPQWLANVMASIVTFSHKWVKNGIILREELPQIWNKYDDEVHETLLAIFEKFEIMYLFPPESPLAGKILTPCLMSVTELPETTAFLADHAPPLSSLRPAAETVDTASGSNNLGIYVCERLYSFDFLPLGFFARLIIRMLHSETVLRVDHFWGSGMFVSSLYGQQTGILRLTNGGKSVHVQIRAKLGQDYSSMRLMSEVVHSIEDLVSLYNVEVQRLVPCNHCILHDPTGPIHNFSYEDCTKAVSTGKIHLYCGSTNTQTPTSTPSTPSLPPNANSTSDNTTTSTSNSNSNQNAVSVEFLAPDLSFARLPIIAEKDIKTLAVLGEGGFGIVRKGLLYGEREVAIKELSVQNPETFREFQHEAFIMSGLDHPNLVKLYGIAVSPLRMIMQLVPHKDLYAFLRGTDPLSLKMKYRIALDIAYGMRYLHGVTPPIVHSDLRSPNVFMMAKDESAPVIATVADFGLAKEVVLKVQHRLETFRWMAPETLEITPEGYNEKADCYSFGIVLWEIATRGQPFSEFDNKIQRQMDYVNKIVYEHLRPTIPPDVPAGLAKLIRDCWQHNPKARPDFIQIAADLTSQLEKLK